MRVRATKHDIELTSVAGVSMLYANTKVELLSCHLSNRAKSGIMVKVRPLHLSDTVLLCSSLITNHQKL